MSHPTWVRGLKFGGIDLNVIGSGSHPTWVRGLKFMYLGFKQLRIPSHPTWVRGLKSGRALDPCRPRRRTPRGCVD